MIVFPDPNVETEYTDPNGVDWIFDGTGWVKQCDCPDGGDGGAGTNDILIVGGGGGGGAGRSKYQAGGGGGAGGLRLFSNIDHTLFSGNTFTVTVGAGGAGGTATSSTGNPGASGQQSLVVDDTGLFDFSASGGGGGGGVNTGSGGADGGSGGGMGQSGQLPAGSGNVPVTNPPQGYAGGRWGGGGADGTATDQGPDDDPDRPGVGRGGPGLGLDITGQWDYYAAGGGAGNNKAGVGGSGHGGWGYSTTSGLPTEPGRDGYGDGGGGGMHIPYSTPSSQNGREGGKGVVIFKCANQASSTTGNPLEINHPDGSYVYRFTSDGTISFSGTKLMPDRPRDMPSPIVEIDTSGNDIDFSNDVTTEDSNDADLP